MSCIVILNSGVLEAIFVAHSVMSNVALRNAFPAQYFILLNFLWSLQKKRFESCYSIKLSGNLSNNSVLERVHPSILHATLTSSTYYIVYDWKNLF